MPEDLLEFVRARSVRQVVRALGIGQGTVHRILHGQYPVNPRRVVSAWDAYRGRADVRASSWFMRRVLPEGTVRHAGAVYGGAGLLGRAGELVAVARSSGGGLLVQTLELPSERFPLVRWPEGTQ